MSNPTRHFYDFDQFRIDIEERVLLRDGAPLILPPKVFDTLLALVERHGHIIEKDDLIKQLWPDTFVEENNLSQCISAIRRALGDGRHEQRYLETIPRRGYRFTGSVREVWDDEEELIQVSHTKMSLRIQEESELGPATSLVAAGPQPKIRSSTVAVVAVVLLLFVGGIIFAAAKLRRSEALAARPPIKTLAVLPLRTTAGADDFAGLAFADDLGTRLRQSLDLNVRPTNSVYKYLRTDRDAVTAGRELKVDAVFDGEVKKTPNAIRIDLRLLDTGNGQVLWQKSYEESAGNLLGASDVLVDHIVQEVFAMPAGSLKTVLAKRSTASAAAHEAYVRGRYYWNNRTAEGLHRSIGLFEQAITNDPAYALAYAGLADAYAFDVGLWNRAEQTARKAVQLDPSLGQPHATIGFVRWFWMWDWDGSEREYKLAIALSPEYATAHQWYAISLAARFYFSQAQLEMQRALELDPLSLPINADLAQILYFQGEFDAAIEQCRHTLALDPNFVNAHVYLHQSYIQKQMYDDAMREYFRVRELQSGNGAIRSNQEPALRAAYEAGGIRGFWQESLKQHDSMPPGIRDPYLKAEFHALLGENEKALDELTVAVSRRSPSMLFVLVNPVFKGLNKDQRFLVLVEQVATVHRKQVENADTSAK